MRHRESEGNCHYSGGLGSSTRAILDSLACESPAGFLEGRGKWIAVDASCLGLQFSHLVTVQPWNWAKKGKGITISRNKAAAQSV